jgi:serine protein kinase
MMTRIDFQKIIENSRKEERETQWEGICLQYLEMVRENPSIAQLAPGRLYHMVMDKGTEPVQDGVKLPDYDDLVRYRFFQDELYGLEEPLHDIMKFFKAGARRTETGKRILILVGPVSSGKSTIANLLKHGLEEDPTPVYSIKGCPIHEEPLHLVPRNQRTKWQEILGVKIEGDLCPMCRFNLLGNDAYRDREGNILWEQFPVIQVGLEEKAGAGSGLSIRRTPRTRISPS